MMTNTDTTSDGMKILWINPLYTDAYDKAMAESFHGVVRANTQVDVTSFAGYGPTHVEYNAYEALMQPQLLQTVRWAEGNGYDAAVIGCFYDPALRAARELTDRMVVTAPAQACLSLASSLGERFSIIVGRHKWIPEMSENVHKYGAADRLASWRVLEMGVDDFQKDPAITEERIMLEARQAVEKDGADVVILGCTAEFGFYRTVQEELGVPVIDATVAPLKHAEHLVDVTRRFGWSHSKRLGFEGPPVADRDRFFPALAPERLVSMSGSFA
jgi:allantoin racemase